MPLDKTLYAYALNLLAAREYSAKSLLKKLVTRGEREDAQAVISHLQEKGYQSDIKYAESYVRYRSNSGFGPMHIRLSLKEKGVSDSDIQIGFEQADIQWQSVLEELYLKKYGQKPPVDFKEKSKRMQFLQRRGFSIECIKVVVECHLRV